MDQKEFHRLMKEASEKLKKAGIDSASAEVEIILAAILDTERINLYLYGEKLLDENSLSRFDQIIDQRTTRRPLQYILGETYFYGRKFRLTSDVMVPTPETELLCDLAIGYIKNENICSPEVLDVGVGSGVVSVTMACEIKSARVTALDISTKAIRIASENADTYGVKEKIEFIQSDIFSNLQQARKFDIVLSNPPYVSEEEYKSLPPEVLADPKISLVSGKEGLDFIKTLIAKTPDYLKPNGRLMFEIGSNQAGKIAEISEKDMRYRSISIMKDLNDIDRVVVLST